ncbi:MAG: RiPP maturation radical SAM C-methyltransferase [Nitrospira sp.]|nr:RiPP maturation radical SAM C-methyltransferase [Nitrospira sp.]MDH4369939.1 RiPP maturation radical SAM C-methyltransferase [Nitrospira sp.]MDH5497649.1 RiPP maturation radical SAM C-methyltransferase [Nitrospira sp.]MDH5725464.1 RiPP maturation radical SAM C-methyltransferase [Nitrospira sp.]
MSEGTKIALVNMPFSYAKYPSIQLGTLAALLKSNGIPVDCHHLNVRFAHLIGVELHESICEKRALFGEWLFSSLLFRENPKRTEYPQVFKPVFEQITQESGKPIGYFEEMATRIAPQFLTWALRSIDWGQYQLIGFTSTFDQNVASLTMAKLIKDLYPDVTIVFGGANFDGEMGVEYFRAFPFIDHVVVGEGEESFLLLVRQVLAGQKGNYPNGVTYRQGEKIVLTPNVSLFSEFAKTGPPDYDDYYHLLAELGDTAKGLDRILLYEGSRGCWWGEKHHCTFCGLNAQSMKFRAKAPQQVIHEIASLSQRYDAVRFRLVDNIIDMAYIDNLFGKLAEDHCDLDVFIETKSNLQKRQIKTLAAGGVKCMQPGLESLSLNQLRAMDKGVTPMQNIVCLKWSLYYHVMVSWNILLGFPGETDEDYQRQLELIPSLVHLQPPEATGKFWLQRFSPYFTRPQEYGIRITGPGMAYEYVYDARQVDLNKIAYDVEYELEHWPVDPHLYQELVAAVEGWQRMHRSSDRPFLYYSKAPNFVTVYDGRNPTTPTRRRYEGLAALVIEICNESAKNKEQIRTAVADRTECSDAILSPILSDLTAQRVLYEERGKYFTLAIPENPYL